MSNIVYPNIRGLDVHILKAPEFASIVQVSPNFAELRIAQSQNPIWHYVLVYNYVKDKWDSFSAFNPYTDLTYLMGFFMARQGKFDDFLYDDTDDDSVTLQTLQLYQDPVTLVWYTPIQRNMGGLFYEDITDINPQGFTNYFNGGGSPSHIFANGYEKFGTTAACGGGADFQILGPGVSVNGNAWGGLVLKWCAAPTGPITGTFKWYFRLRFEEDTMEFEKFLWNVWTVGGPDMKSSGGSVKMMTSRKAAV